MREYIFAPEQRVISGVGSRVKLQETLERLGRRRVFLLTGRTLATQTTLVREVEGLLGSVHAGTFAECRQHVPAATVRAATEAAREVGADCLVAFGGGSPIDTAKVVAIELLGDRPREELPQIALPTTLSAGEFTFLAGVTDEQTRIKRGRADRRAMPAVVIHDPELTEPTPRELWAATGIKALDHAIEALWSARAHPVTDALAMEAIRKLRRHLRASLDPSNVTAREECFMAAWMSIFGAINVGMRLTHPLGHQIGARWDIPHGVTSCVVLPEAMRWLAPVTAPAQRKIAEAMGADVVGQPDDAAAEMAARAVEELLADLGVPRRLRETSAKHEELEIVAEAVSHELKVFRSPDADRATPEELGRLLERCW